MRCLNPLFPGVLEVKQHDHAELRRHARERDEVNGPLIERGAVQRVRPKAMTVAKVLADTGTGSKVTQRIATPMVGGAITAALLSIFGVHAAYLLMRRPRQPRAEGCWKFWRRRRAAGRPSASTHGCCRQRVTAHTATSRSLQLAQADTAWQVQEAEGPLVPLRIAHCT